MVNTFIPYEDFTKCAKVLDNQRLGKQRVEAKQILNILTDATTTKGWRSHPVVLMWRGYEKALMLYYNTIVTEWIARGFVNNMTLYPIKGKVHMPWFIGNKSIHMSHRANLIRKKPEFYKKFFPHTPSKYIKYRYIWPTKLSPEQVTELIQHKDGIVDIEKFSTKWE